MCSIPNPSLLYSAQPSFKHCYSAGCGLFKRKMTWLLQYSALQRATSLFVSLIVPYAAALCYCYLIWLHPSQLLSRKQPLTSYCVQAAREEDDTSPARGGKRACSPARARAGAAGKISTLSCAAGIFLYVSPAGACQARSSYKKASLLAPGTVYSCGQSQW